MLPQELKREIPAKVGGEENWMPGRNDDIMADLGEITYEKKGRVALFTLKGRTDLNPITAEMYEQLYHHLEDFNNDRKLWVGILTGHGKRAFSAGGDIRRMEELDNVLTEREHTIGMMWYPWEKPMAPGTGIKSWTMELWKPIIAAVNGPCLGTAFMTLLNLTDIRFAAPHATFGFPEAKLGLAGHGSQTRLAAQIPYPIAMHLIMSGDTINSEKAERLGLVNEVVPLADLMPKAEAYAQKLCEGTSGIGLMVEKEAVLRGLEMSRYDSMRFGRMLNVIQRHLGDSAEGQKAFLEKRKPRFKGFDKV